MDTTLQMMVSTLTAALITLCLAVYKQKGLLEDTIRWIKMKLGRATYNPLEFDPSLADGKPKNGKTFLYQATFTSLGESCIGAAWFLKHHKTKFYTLEKQDKSIHIRTTATEPLSNPQIFGSNFIICKDVYIPVWKDLNGYWVYIYAENEDIKIVFRLVSDSYVALENCQKSILELNAQINEEDKQKIAERAAQKKERIICVPNGGMLVSAGIIPMNKVFDNLFFEQKEEILHMLKAFKENTLFPSHLPMDNKLGILLHGSPGTGKTGFISSLANYLQRDVVIVDMAKIKSQSDLNQLLVPSRNKSYIYVFEEFDCMPCIQKREANQPTQVRDEKMTPEMMMMMTMNAKDTAMAEEYKKERDAQKDKIDLGYLLRKLDGLEAANDRIIIATTNHPDRIDPALLRPGRFGIQIHMKKANQEILRQIVSMIYKSPISEDDVYEIDDYKWSPAEVLQMSLLHKRPQDLLTALRNEQPSSDKVSERH